MHARRYMILGRLDQSRTLLIGTSPSVADAITRANRAMNTGRYSRVTVTLGGEEVYVA